jgi:hypothetical protein
VTVEERLRAVILERHPDADPGGVRRWGLVDMMHFQYGPRRRGPPRRGGAAADIAGQAKILDNTTDELERHLKHVAPDYSEELDPVLETWERIVSGQVVRDQATLKRLSEEPKRGHAMDQAARERWRAPSFDEDELVFFGNHGDDFLEVRIHTKEHWVEQERVGQGHREIFLYRGRPLVEGEDPREAVMRDLGEGEAAEWRRAGLEEHAAEAAFRRAALELLSLGAPAALVERHREAALEEAEHARTCFGLATLVDGRCVPPPPRLEIEPRAPDLETVAREALFHGWIGERLAAERARDDAKGSREPGARAALQKIAREEAGHSTLGRDVVRWAARAGARRALWGAVRRGAPRDLEPRWPSLRKQIMAELRAAGEEQ